MTKVIKLSAKTVDTALNNVALPPTVNPTRSVMQIACKTAIAFRFESMRVEQTDSEGMTRIYMVDGIEKSIFFKMTTTALNVPASFSVMNFIALLPLLADASSVMTVAAPQVRMLEEGYNVEVERPSHFEFSSGGALLCHHLGNPAMAPKAVLNNVPVWDIQFEFKADDASLKTAVNHMKRLKKLESRFGLSFEGQQVVLNMGAWGKVPLNVSILQLPIDHDCVWQWKADMFITLVSTLTKIGVTSVIANVSLTTGLLLLKYVASVGDIRVEFEAIIPGKDLRD